MNENVIFPIGNIVMLDIIKKDYGYFDFILVAISAKVSAIS